MTTDAKPLTKDEIEELEKLEREATPGPWTCEHHIVSAGTERVAVAVASPGNDRYLHNTRLVSAARNALPSLLASARAHASALARAEAAEARAAEAVRVGLEECAAHEATIARTAREHDATRDARYAAERAVITAEHERDEALSAAASLRERVRALEEGLTIFLDATRFAEDLRRAIPVVDLNAARTRARALLAPTKESGR